MSYLHVRWMTSSAIVASGGGPAQYLRTKLNKFLRRHTSATLDTEEVFPPEFCEVDRILASRPAPNGTKEDDMQYLCKWVNLPYSEATWEVPSAFKDTPKIASFNRNSQVPSLATLQAKGSKASSSEWTKLEESPSYKGNELRPWQIDGVNWLMTNWTHRRGCILADEMGLGKLPLHHFC
jgi:chromodomain-helicase-DNA-binding protein 7